MKVSYCVVVSFDLMQESKLHTAFTPTFSGSNMDTEIRGLGEAGSVGRSLYLIRSRQHSDPVWPAFGEDQVPRVLGTHVLGRWGCLGTREEIRTDCCSCSWEEGFFFALCKKGREKDYLGGTPTTHAMFFELLGDHYQHRHQNSPDSIRPPSQIWLQRTSLGAAEDIAVAVFIHQMNEKKE